MSKLKDSMLRWQMKELHAAIKQHDPETRFQIYARLNLALSKALGQIDEQTYQFARKDMDAAKVILLREVKSNLIELEARKK